MSLRDQLQVIYDEHGRLTPAHVVDAARPADHPLHERFEWDNAVAGEAYRLDQARRLIRSVRVVYREADEKEAARTVRAYHAVRDEQGAAYRATDEIVESEFLTKIVMQDMQREWLQLKRRYGQFAEFIAMVRGDLEEKAA
jgi:hypothetical protein